MRKFAIFSIAIMVLFSVNSVNVYAKTYNGLDKNLVESIDQSDSMALNVMAPPSPLAAAKGDGITDDTEAIQNCLNSSKIVLLPAGYNFLIGELSLNDGQEVIIDGTIKAKKTWTGSIFIGEGVTNVIIKGTGKCIGNNQDNMACIVFGNSSNCSVNGLQLSGFKNKGIDFGDGCSNCSAINNTIDGSNGTLGAGISLFDARNCVVTGNHVTTSRIGISLNAGEKHLVSGNVLSKNILAGIVLDGIVTDSGDGTKNSTVQDNVIKGCTDTNHGALYLGNGASYNTINKNIITGNTRSGIGLTTDDAHPLLNNIITNNIIKQNDRYGIEASDAQNTVIKGNHIISNTLRGLSLLSCDGSSITLNQIISNGAYGMLNLSGNCYICDNKIKDHTITGIEIADGGGTSPIGNTVSGNLFASNSVDVVAPSDNTVTGNYDS